jgi:hypothetical protein
LRELARECVVDIEPLFLRIKQVAELTAESEWTVKDKLRRGIYAARKSGRATLVDFASVKLHLESLPRATFSPPTRVGAPALETEAKRRYRKRVPA